MMKLPPHYTFQDARLGERALTHRSFSVHNNEQLEWLGDAVLEFEISCMLFQKFPQMSEGALSQLRTCLVNGETLAQVAQRLDLGAYARLGSAGMHAGRENRKLLANLTEAYLAAIYLDGGDVTTLLHDWFDEEIDTLAAQMKKHGTLSLRDAKTQLQEHLQKNGSALPVYTLVHQQGKDGNALFTVECRINDAIHAEGCASSRAKAETRAAAACLQILRAVVDVVEKDKGKGKPAAKQSAKKAAKKAAPAKQSKRTA